MHRKLASLAARVESEADRQLLLDASQELQNGERAIRILVKLCRAKRISIAIWIKAFDFVRSINR